MVDYQKKIAEVIRQDPNVDALVSSVGGAASATLGGPNFGQLVIHLKPRSERKLLVNDVIAELRPKLSGFEGMKVYLQNPPTIRIGGQVTTSPYPVSMQSPDKGELSQAAGQLRQEIERLPGLEDVTSDVQIATPQVNVEIDRDKAAALQVSAQQIENALYDAYGPRWVSTIYAAINEYKVLLELMPQYQADPRALSLLYFKANNNRLIPMGTLAHMSQESGPQTINHYGQLPAATISFNLKPGASLGDALNSVQDLAKRGLPVTISTTFQGAAKAFQGSLTNLWILMAVAIMVVYIVLCILYENYIHPLTILSGLPSAEFDPPITLSP